MNFKELRKQSGMTQQQFADYFGIPKRTIENWEAGVNKCPQYLLDLMEYKLNIEQPSINIPLPIPTKETLENVQKQLKKSKISRR